MSLCEWKRSTSSCRMRKLSWWFLKSMGGANFHCSRGNWSDPSWKYGLSCSSSSTERNSVPSLSAEASSIGFAAALPKLGVLATSESSGSSSTSDIKRLAADICCIMLAKGGATADRPAPGRQSSEALVQSRLNWARRSGEIGWGDRSVGTRPSAPPL